MAEGSVPGNLDPRATASAAAPEAPAARPADLAALLSRQIAALVETTGASRIAAWGRGADGVPGVLAARVEGAALRPPSEAAWRALAALAGPTDLARASDPELVKLAGEYGFDAAAPLRGEAGEPLAVLLLGTDGAAGQARPRLLAALASAVAKSLRPAAAAAALERLARLDGEVQRIDRLAAVGGLLAEIVHEIRNPLVSIKTFLHLLGEDGGADPGEFREVAIEELRRIERLLEAVSQHARPPSAPSAEAFTEVEPAVRSVAQLAALRAVVRRVEVETQLAGPLAPVRIAGDSLRQVLLNLALNAIEAAPEGGHVRIAAAQRGGSVEIAIEDDGPGVPDALRARVFEPFFSTKVKPGGLGLAITKRLVEDAGGSIEVEDCAPTGSRFRVELPIAR